jgi:S1-C subfamily serine protease
MCDNCPSTVALPLAHEPVTKCSGELFKNFKDATVSLSIVPKFNLTINPTSATGAGTGTGSTGTGPFVQLPIIPYNLSGFFLDRNGYVVSSSGFLQAVVVALFFFYIGYLAASTPGLPTPSPMVPVILPAPVPVLPTIDQVLCIIFDPNNPRSLADFFEIFITVFNVNGCGKAYIYKGCLIGADFDTGVAVFIIDKCDLWNKCVVPIKKHPFLKFGTSKCYTPGNPVHIIASYTNNSPQSMASGSVVQNTNVVTDGNITYESMQTDVAVLPGVEGAAILDQCGYVVGIVTGINGTNATAFGVTAGFIQKVVCALIEGFVAPGCNKHVLYNDIFGFGIYRHATLGLSYYVRTGTDIGVLSADVVYPAPIERWYDPSYCSINRQLIGLLVRSVTGNLADAIEECTTLQFPPFMSGKTVPVVPNGFVGFQIQPLDLITGIADIPVGELPYQMVPDTLLYELLPCATLNITFMKASENYTQCHNLCTETDDSLGWLFNIPPVVSTLATIGGGTVGLSTISSQLLLYFFNALPQVYRLSFINNIYAIYGAVFPEAGIAAGLQLFYDYFSVAGNVTVQPGYGLNLNYLLTVTSNTGAFPQSFYNIIAALTPTLFNGPVSPQVQGALGLPLISSIGATL